MLKLSFPPDTTVVYNSLKSAATSDPVSRKKLAALEVTLDHFKVRRGRETVGESLLRLELVAEGRPPRAKGQPAKKLISMFKYYRSKCK